MENYGYNQNPQFNYNPQESFPQQGNPQGYAYNQFTQPYPNYQVAEDAITGENKALCILSWLPALSWIMYLVKKDDKAVVRCANQGFIALLGVIVLSLVSSLIGGLIGGVIGSLISGACGICTTVIGVFCLIGFIKACQSEHWEMPIIGNIKIFK